MLHACSCNMEARVHACIHHNRASATHDHHSPMHEWTMCFCAIPAVAEVAFGMPMSQLANPWWLYLESQFLESNLGKITAAMHGNGYAKISPLELCVAAHTCIEAHASPHQEQEHDAIKDSCDSQPLIIDTNCSFNTICTNACI